VIAKFTLVAHQIKLQNVMKEASNNEHAIGCSVGQVNTKPIYVTIR
jgi:hypothetical protein